MPSGSKKQTRLSCSQKGAHGVLYHKDWTFPITASESVQEARPGYTKVRASEYLDEPWVLKEKVKELAKLLKKSNHAVAYTGAGMSTASGIPDYATKAPNTVAERPANIPPANAMPSKAHRVLVDFHKKGLIKYWVQQNHDGLPQKAGLPQHAINEIHGSWWDPSNPVVKMSGDLRDDLFTLLLECEQTTDLCLAVGTSLSGMNADRVATSAAERFAAEQKQKTRKDETKNAWLMEDCVHLGLVIITIQQTTADEDCTLRIFADINTVFKMLAEEMGVDESGPQTTYYVPDVPREALASCVFRIPYDNKGKRHKVVSEESKTILKLTEGSRLRITSGPYAGSIGTVTGRHKEGHFQLRVSVEIKKITKSGRKQPKASSSFMATVPMKLGLWYVEAAVKGTLPELPVVSLK
eukprot:m.335691 g.335691  ORF g.335691 m.335691 type:complete len:410 (+) comp17654_c0_seq1:90-1319(+)